MKKRFHIGTMLLLAITLLISCSERPGSDAGEKILRLAFVPKLRDNPVFGYAKIAAEHRAHELGSIEIIWRAPNEPNAVEQGQFVSRLVGMGVDGIAISCNEAEALRRPINEAVKAGIPVMCFDADSPNSERSYMYGTDDVAAGRTMGQEIARLIGGKGEIAILSGFSGADNLNLRVKGVKDYIAENHSEITVVNTLHCDDDVKKGIDLIASYMQTKPKLDGWVSVGGWPTWGIDGLAAINPEVTKVVCFDSLPEQWRYLENGKCQVLVSQDIWGWGEKSVDVLKLLAEGKKYEGASTNGLIPAPNEVLTADNVAAYKEKWRGWFGNPK